MKKRKTVFTVLMLLSLVLAVIVYGHFENNSIKIDRITVADSALPEGFDGFTVLHISDLHGKSFGSDNSNLLKLMAECTPDVIFITGDLIDSRSPRIDTALSFVEKARSLAPIFYVSGNHEARSGLYGELSDRMKLLGVNVMDNRLLTLQRNGSEALILGLGDPALSNDFGVTAEAIFDANLNNMDLPEKAYTFVLCHRPEAFPYYTQNGFNAVFCGHAHGGQIRLPLVGGLYAPHQGFFPQYTKGVYQQNLTSMIISPGLGNSAFPLRINNNPEIIAATFKRP